MHRPFLGYLILLEGTEALPYKLTITLSNMFFNYYSVNAYISNSISASSSFTNFKNLLSKYTAGLSLQLNVGTISIYIFPLFSEHISFIISVLSSNLDISSSSAFLTSKSIITSLLNVQKP